MRLIFALTSLLACSLVSPYEDHSLPSLPLVAVDALRDSFEQVQGSKWEYGGIITKYLGHFYASSPVTDKNCCELVVPVRAMLEQGHVLVGIFHTHTCFPTSHVPGEISLPDKAASVYWNVPAFVLNACTGDVLTFDPTPVVQRLGARNAIDIDDLNDDSIIGNIGEVSPSQE
jgi:hypothetical protein